MANRALAELIKQLLRLLSEAEAKTKAATMPEVRRDPRRDRRLTDPTDQLGYNLADLGREVNRRIEERQQAGRPMKHDEVRAYVLNRLEGWAAYLDVEGAWMHAVEGLRPEAHKAPRDGAAHKALMDAARAAIGVVHAPASATVPVPAALTSGTEAGDPAWIDRATIEAKRVGVGLVCGLISYAIVAGAVAGTPGGARPSLAVPGIVAAAIGCVAFGVGMILGYAVARRLIRLPTPVPAVASAPAPAGPLPTEESGPPGWAAFKTAMVAWFVRFIREDDKGDDAASVAKECLDLARRLGLRETFVEECRKEAERLKLLEPVR
jgi:hypothetical protein